MVQRRRFDLQSAYVLHGRAYRNTSMILELLTAQHGRIALVARGVRQARSRLQGLLQPFQRVSASWTIATELGTLTAVEAEGDRHWLQGAALVSGLYVNELLIRLLHRDDPHPQLFSRYEYLLRDLAGRPDNQVIERTLRLFEKHALGELGYGLLLEHEVHSGHAIDAELYYHYIPDLGPVQCPPSGRSRQPSTDGVIVAGRSLRALASESLTDADSLRDAKRLMRCLLHHCLGGRPLKSRELYRVYA